MSVNIRNLESVLATAQNAALSDDDILYYSKIINQLKSGAVFTVATFADLPQTASVENGNFYLVENEGTVYIPNKKSNSWIQVSQDIVGLIWGWGVGTFGQIGDNTINTKASPVSIVGCVNSWIDVSLSVNSARALKENGTIWAWGTNSSGELGDNSTVSRSSPVSVVGGFTDWCALSLSAGQGATAIALRSNGTLWAWGVNSGRLGDGTTINRSSPVSVIGGFDDWCQVSTGASSAAAVRKNGSLWAWGTNSQGRLGDDTIVNRSSPVSVVGGFTDWCQVSVGNEHTIALRCDGSLWSWGSNSRGRLGDNTSISRSSPGSVVGGITDWCQIAAGNYSSSALRSSGTLWRWGGNSCGELGDNSVVSKSSPVAVVGGFTNWCAIAAGIDHSMAIRTDGTLWAWGCNNSCYLADGTNINRSSPVSVIGGFTDWWKISTTCCNTTGIRLII